MRRIGVLALQGGFDPHLRALSPLNVEAVLVRSWAEIEATDALIIPGGESTTIGKLLVLHGLMHPLQDRIRAGFPVFGTCAGLILLSKRALGREQPLLGVLDVDVSRNAYGRQTESFETSVPFVVDEQVKDLPAVFIRAPQIARVGTGVDVLAQFEDSPVCVRQGKILAASFHPELTQSPVLHDYFLSLV